MSAPSALAVKDLHASYGAVRAVDGVDLVVPEGAVVAVIGPNGAGKTTALRAIGGQCKRRGSVVLGGRDISRWKAHRIAGAGFAQVPQGRRLFPELTVEENLLVGAWRRSVRQRADGLKQAYGLFPAIAKCSANRAGSLSGGEQQMVAIARALMSDPKVIAMDEPSLGLAPIVVREMFGVVGRLRERGVAVLLVEQNATQALAASDYVYVLNRGQVVHHGPSETLDEDFNVVSAYLR